MSKKNQNKKEEVKPEVKAEETANQETKAVEAETAPRREPTSLEVAIQAIMVELELIPTGHREIDLAKAEIEKHMMHVFGRAQFIAEVRIELEKSKKKK